MSIFLLCCEGRGSNFSWLSCLLCGLSLGVSGVLSSFLCFIGDLGVLVFWTASVFSQVVSTLACLSFCWCGVTAGLYELVHAMPWRLYQASIQSRVIHIKFRWWADGGPLLGVNRVASLLFSRHRPYFSQYFLMLLAVQKGQVIG